MEVFYFPENSFLTMWISSTDYRFLISLYNGLQKLKTFNFSSDSTMLVNGEKLIYAFLCFSHSFSYSRELHVKKMLK